jgi:apolipoprotein N-acyltransferase
MLLMNSAILADSRRVLKDLNQDVRDIAECQLVLMQLVIMVVRVFVTALLLFLFLSLFILDFLLLSLLFNL